MARKMKKAESEAHRRIAVQAASPIKRAARA